MLGKTSRQRTDFSKGGSASFVSYMSRTMGPTAKFVGPTDCAQAQAVARLLPLNLVNQLGRGRSFVSFVN